MVNASFLLTILLSGVSSVVAQSTANLWGQCGGSGWSGPTVCAPGSWCNAYNPYYSQCIPATSTSTMPSTTTSQTSNTPITRTVVTTTGSTRTVSTSTPSPTPSGYQIRGVSDPVYHLYLQSLNGVPMLGPATSGGYFAINGSIRYTTVPYTFLNIINATTSYKPLAFNGSATFTGWGLEGDTIITTASSTYGRQLNFLACPSTTSGYFQLYLQTGSDVPSSSCTSQTIHLPCLC